MIGWAPPRYYQGLGSIVRRVADGIGVAIVCCIGCRKLRLTSLSWFISLGRRDVRSVRPNAVSQSGANDAATQATLVNRESLLSLLGAWMPGGFFRDSLIHNHL